MQLHLLVPMTSDESEHPPHPPAESSEEDWEDAWSAQEPQSDAKRPSGKLQNPLKSAQEQAEQAEQALFPEGVEDFEAARPQKPLKGFEAAGQFEEPEALAPKPKRVKRKDVAMETLSGDRKGIEEREWSDPTVFSPKWTASITLFVLAVVIGCLFLLHQSGPATKGGSKTTQQEQQQKKIDAIEAQLVELNGREQEARKMYADFASAQVVEDILPMIRNSGKLAGLVRNTAHQTIVDKDWRPPARAKWSINLMRARPYATLKGDLPDFTTFCAYYVLEDGLLLLDWKATTTFSTSSYEELSNGKGDGSEVRGYVKPAQFYTNDFPEDQYHCYQMVSPDKRHVLWCYVKRSSAQAQILGRHYLKGEILQESGRELPMTLKLSRASGKALPNQWVIESLLHEEWISLP